MNKKIGTITFFNVNNFGAELQAYALLKVLKDLNYDAELINYPFYKNKRHIRTKLSEPIHPLPLKKKIKEKLYPVYSRLKSLSNSKSKNERQQLFKNFHENYTNVSNVEFRKYEDLKNSDLKYDAVIVGSDQVWNPYLGTSLNPYFLDFLNSSVKRISYAASFGVSQIPEIQQNYYITKLLKFNQVSVREKSGKHIINKLLPNLEVSHVLDPTLLLDSGQWMSVASNNYATNDYLLIYAIADSEYLFKLALSISEKLNLKIKQITKDSYIQNDSKKVENLINVGPSEFIELFQKASFVLTTSFHGTCFSVNFRKPFYTLLDKGKDNNSRQIDFLTSVKLDNRIVYFGDEDVFDKNQSIHKDLSSFSVEAFEKQKSESIKFLIRAIND